MQLLYKTKTENKSGLLLFLLTSGIAVIVGFSILTEIPEIKSPSNVIDILLLTVLSLGIISFEIFIFDEAVWQMKGKEVCMYDNSSITIVKYRLIKIRKNVKWESIDSVYEYNPCLVKSIVTFITIAGESQNHITISYNEGKKRKRIKCGANLSPHQARKVMKFMIAMTNNAHEGLRRL